MIPQGQVGAVVNVGFGEHGHVGRAHADDMAGVPGPVTAAVLVANGRGGEGDGADGE